MTEMSILVYGVDGDPNNETVRERVRCLRGVDVNVVFCPPAVRDLYRVPFVQDETGARHFGVDGIDRFVTRRLEIQRVG